MLATSALGARSLKTEPAATETAATASSEYVSEDNNVVESLGDVVNGNLKQLFLSFFYEFIFIKLQVTLSEPSLENWVIPFRKSELPALLLDMVSIKLVKKRDNFFKYFLKEIFFILADKVGDAGTGVGHSI